MTDGTDHHLNAPSSARQTGLILLVVGVLMLFITALLAPRPVTALSSLPKVYGINLAGAEWNETALPGVIHRDYLYPADTKRSAYFAGQGLTLVRVPFRWERLQPKAHQPLSKLDVAGLRSVLDIAALNHQHVILVVQNFGRYYNDALTTNDLSKFADLFTRLSQEFRTHPALVGYELMNEPHDLSGGSATWAALAQAATNAIRKVDKTVWILIPGYHWQTASTWRTYNENLDINDGSGRLLYAAHQYFDADLSGRHAHSYNSDLDSNGKLPHPNIRVDRLKPFTDWLAAKGFRGIVTEYGIPNYDGDSDPVNQWDTVLENFLQAVDVNPNLLGGTYWAAGSWWGSYPLSVEPGWSLTNSSVPIPRPQMAVLAQYPSHN